MSPKNQSNTLILTDQELLDSENQSILKTTIDALKDFIESLNKLNGIHSCLQILHLKSFGRILLIFSRSEFAQFIYSYLKKLKIKVGFSRNDNVINECSLCDQIVPPKSDIKLTVKVDNDNSIHEKLPQRQVCQKLEPPDPPIQMQSPPPSPYEGWINQPEDPPSGTTIGYHPKKLSHLLYTIDPVTNEHRRVFSSFIDSEQPLCNYTSDHDLQHLDLGEPLIEAESKDNIGIFTGSLFQNSSLTQQAQNVPIRKNSNLKIPMLVIDHDEAQNIKGQAQKFLEHIDK